MDDPFLGYVRQSWLCFAEVDRKEATLQFGSMCQWFYAFSARPLELPLVLSKLVNFYVKDIVKLETSTSLAQNQYE
jgi:hypothetical protein